MPQLIEKHEKFAAAYVALDCNGTKAAIEAGYAERTAANQASRLLNRDDILNRIETLQSKSRVRHNVTIDSLVTELEQAREVAERNGQAAAMAQATLGKAKLLGLVVDKSKVQTTINLETLSDSEIESYVAELESALPETIKQ